MTYLEIVSRIQNHLNTLNKDMFIPRRFILSVVKSKGEFLMAQRFNEKSIFRETNLYEWLNCIKMTEVDTVKCGKIEFQTCDTAMKSKKKLPKLLWSRYGSSLIMVTNIDNSKQYEVITQTSYLNYKKMKGFDKFKGKYAILYPDGHLWIPDSTVKIINALVYTLDETASDICECDDTSDNCQSYWDKEFNIPDKIREVAIQEALKDITVRLQIPKDENPQGDSNLKSREG